MRQNFSHVLRIVTQACTKSFEWIKRVLYVFVLCNDELERNFTLHLRGANCNSFFIILDNNFRVKIYRCLCAAYGEENVMNLINILQWQSMFWERRINIHNDKYEKWLGMTDETVWCVLAHLEDDHYSTIRTSAHLHNQMSSGNRVSSLCYRYVISQIAHSCDHVCTCAITGRSTRQSTSKNF